MSIRCPGCGLTFANETHARQHLAAKPKCAATTKFYELKGKGPSWFAGMDLSSISPSIQSNQIIRDALRNELTPEEIRCQLNYMKQEFDRKLSDATNHMMGIILRLEKKIVDVEKIATSHNLDPKWHRAAKEATDYTKVFDEVEDGYEEDYRGWPKIKPRVIF